MKYSVLLEYPGLMQKALTCSCYFANRIEAMDVKGAIRQAQREALMAQPPAERKGFTQESFSVLLVVEGHHDAEFIS